MFEFLDSFLMEFRICFRKARTFQWFVVIVIGLMIRTDHQGITSVIRDLHLIPNYVSMINFFRSNAWNLDVLISKWCTLIKRFAPLMMVDDYVILVGDGVKQAKEGRRMPGVKKHHQESEDVSKAEYIWGHLFGGIGILAGNAKKYFCLPLTLALHDGVKTIFGWSEPKERQGSHVVEMIRLGARMASHFKKAILLLDGYFLSVPALKMLADLKSNHYLLDIVTRAKRSCTAYLEPPERKPGTPGRPPKKGAAVKVYKLFESRKDQFLEADVVLYGKQEHIRYYCLDLLWGQKLYQKLRFVLVAYSDSFAVFVSTNTMLQPLDIIELYSRRFSIECMFKSMKQVVHGFSCRFWSKFMSKLNRYKKKTDPDPLAKIDDTHAREKIRDTVKAIEGYVFCCCAAIGLLQMLSIRFSDKMDSVKVRYLRTPNREVVSEATMADYIRKNIFWCLRKYAHLGISQIITDKQEAVFEKMEAS
jgi:hypothetical protein